MLTQAPITPTEAIALITVLTGIISVFVSLTTTVSAAKKEAVTALQDTVEILQKQSAGLANENVALRAKMEEMQKAGEARYQQLQQEIEAYRLENEALRDWAEALVAQVEGLGHKPVPFRAKKRGTK